MKVFEVNLPKENMHPNIIVICKSLEQAQHYATGGNQTSLINVKITEIEQKRHKYINHCSYIIIL